MFVTAVIFATLALLITGDAQEPSNDNPDCNEENRANHVLKTCTLRCGGDELVPLNGSEKCYLSSAKHTEVEPTPVERTEAGAEVGICQEGACVEKPQDFQSEATS
uniref:Putative secreted protein n=1 Tax=Amblyomma americanum TaxID=6943 RepID=A0A0C9RVY7_AMBAM